MRSRRIAIVWPLLPTYLAKCLSTLATEFNYEIHLFALGGEGVGKSDAFVESENFHNVSVNVFPPAEFSNAKLIERKVLETSPEALIIAGWGEPASRNLIFAKSASQLPKVMTSDNTQKRTLKQSVGKYLLRPIFKRVDAILVPGDRGSELMKAWGVPASKICRGMYSIDFDHFHNANAIRNQQPSDRQRSFVFVGQLIERKGFDYLLEGYCEYRNRVSEPWKLIVCGRGPLEKLAMEVSGVELMGFVNFNELPEIYAKADVFVFPSVYDAWGVALVESAAAGLACICTSDCGAAADLVCDGYNGLIIPHSDSREIAKSMQFMHEQPKLADEMGRRCIERAKGYSDFNAASQWNRAVTKAFKAL